MKYLNIFIFFFVTFQTFIAQFLHDLIVNFVPSFGHVLIHPSISDTMRQAIMQPGWGPYIYNLNSYTIFDWLQMLTYLMIPALIFCIPIILAQYLYRYRILYVIPAMISLIILACFNLLSFFNSDVHGPFILLFTPIYGLIPWTIITIVMIIIDRFILKPRSSE